MNGSTKWIMVALALLINAVAISLSYGRLTAEVSHLANEQRNTGIMVEGVRDDLNHHMQDGIHVSTYQRLQEIGKDTEDHEERLRQLERP